MNSNTSTLSNGYTVQWINENSDSSSVTGRIIKTIYDKNGTIVQVYADSLSEVTFDYDYKTLLNRRVISRKLVPTTEERIEEYIKDNYDRYIVQDYGSYIYQMIQEKAYDFASEVVEEAKEDYIMDNNEDSIIDSIMEEIDFDSLYELVEDILNAPITMEEKLAEVGMSIRDFL